MNLLEQFDRVPWEPGVLLWSQTALVAPEPALVAPALGPVKFNFIHAPKKKGMEQMKSR